MNIVDIIYLLSFVIVFAVCEINVEYFKEQCLKGIDVLPYTNNSMRIIALMVSLFPLINTYVVISMFWAIPKHLFSKKK